MDPETKLEAGAKTKSSAGSAPPSRFCIGCDEGLPGGAGPAACPRCGGAYDPRDPETFKLSPSFHRLKFWLPGLSIAVVCGVASYASLLLASGNKGVALFFAVPASVGAILGFATRTRVWGLTALALGAVILVVSVLYELELAGLFCGMVGVLIFAVPAFLGALLGLILRIFLKTSGWGQRFYLPLAAMIAVPYVADRIERLFPRPAETALVETRAIFDASPRQAFQSIVFYEEVQHRPPFLLRLALPRPVRSVGAKTREGGAVTCIYERGYLRKRITHIEEGRLLAFEVIEQKLHFERDVKLLDGSFEVLPAESGASSVVLATRYEPLLYPRWLWEPMERRVVHALHAHVLEGMQRRAEAGQELALTPPSAPAPSRSGSRPPSGAAGPRGTPRRGGTSPRGSP